MATVETAPLSRFSAWIVPSLLAGDPDGEAVAGIEVGGVAADDDPAGAADVGNRSGLRAVRAETLQDARSAGERLLAQPHTAAAVGGEVLQRAVALRDGLPGPRRARVRFGDSRIHCWSDHHRRGDRRHPAESVVVSGAAELPGSESEILGDDRLHHLAGAAEDP